MRRIKSLLLTVIGLLCSVGMNAYDIVKDGVYYNILSQEDKTVEVTSGGGSNKYTGDVIIPSSIAEDVIKETFPDWTSTNKSNGSSSQNSYTFVVDVGDKLQFNWSVSSESNFDWLIITLDGVEIIKKSGSVSGKFDKVFETSDTHTLVVKYTKDSSASSGNDEGGISNITLKTSGVPSLGTYSVVSIDGHAFYGCSNLTSVSIPNSIKRISDGAFCDCI